MTSAYKPWRVNLRAGTRFLAAGTILLVLGLMGIVPASFVPGAVHSALPVRLPLELGYFAWVALSLGVLCMWMARAQLQKSWARYNGKRLEIHAISEKDFPTDWEVRKNYVLPQGGDLDLYVRTHKGDVFAIEIKSLQSIRVDRSFFGGYTLKRRNGDGFERNPHTQTIANARAVRGHPVLWLPLGNASTRQMDDGLIIVQGNKHKLMRVLESV